MDVRISPGKLNGRIRAIDSKSHAHRLLIAAFLSGRGCEVRIRDTNEDIEATKACLKILRAGGQALFDCGESGSTLRFLLPLASLFCERADFVGRGKLPERPLGALTEELARHGCGSSAAEPASFRAPGGSRYILGEWGRLRSGLYELPGDVSSQFVTGLLFALPLLEGRSEIRLSTPLQSRKYVDMTLRVLGKFGISAEERSYRSASGELLPLYIVEGMQKYAAPAAVLLPEGDWSAAAFWIAASCLGRGSKVSVHGLEADSVQPDRRIAELAKEIEKNSESRRDMLYDVSQTPDLLPILSVLACSRKCGKTKFVNAARLRLKESDRLAASEKLINDLGGSAHSDAASLTVEGRGGLKGGTADGCGDHRIVMSAAIASLLCESDVTIKGAEAAAKSYPSFFDDFRSLGGRYAAV